MAQMILQGRYSVDELADACGIPSYMASERLQLILRCGFLNAEEREARNQQE